MLPSRKTSASTARAASMSTSAKYTGPDYNYGYPEWSKHTVTVTAFVDDKWYQSTYTVSICNEGC